MEIKVTCDIQNRVDYKSLVPTQGELKSLSKENYNRFKKSVLKYGIHSPCAVWNNSGVLQTLDGHQRCLGFGKMESEGYKIPLIPIYTIDAPDLKTAKEILLTLVSQYGHIEGQGLYEFTNLSGLDLEFLKDITDLPGLDLNKYEAEFYKEINKGQCDEDEVPEKVEAKTKLGDVYLLGAHRLLCGDSTNVKEVEKLMNGEKADMVFTDPPYGVSYTGKNEYLNSLGKPMSCPKAIENDEKTPEQMYEFWLSAFKNICDSLSDKGSYYITAPQGGDLLLLLQSVRQSGFQLKHILVWAKNNHVLGRCDYHYKHEPIVYGWKQKGTHEFYGKGQMSTSVWNFNKPLKNDLHPTMKPIELIQEALMNSSLENQNIIDLFGGSGSTLIACEKTNRKCFMMELDPHYCDVIVARWEKYTGKKAELIN